ncbi:MAG TPA: hypothetical protein VH916_13145, partial [Dehalococcoidia bacterium]
MAQEPYPTPALPPDTVARYPLIAWLPDRDRAVAAVEELRAAGFADADAVLWLGEQADASERMP